MRRSSRVFRLSLAIAVALALVCVLRSSSLVQSRASAPMLGSSRLQTQRVQMTPACAPPVLRRSQMPYGVAPRGPLDQEVQRHGMQRDVKVHESMFSRVGRVIRSYTNSFISKMEDPEKILDQAVEDMQKDLIKLRQASAQVMASQKQIQTKYNTAKNTADEWYKRAELALEKGEEDLAREALSRKKTFTEVANGLKSQLEQQEKAMSTLLGNVRTLEGKLAEAKSKKDTLKARAASARTQKQISEMTSGLDTSSAFSAFEKMEEKVTALEAESESVAILAGNDSLESSFKELEQGNVDDDLMALKRKMGGEATRPVAGTLVKSDAKIDSELEALRNKMNKP
eukprot:CAMPEP_0167794928 /NCGR_PEP_ID=MMETSP0111_2-20121227/14135_1 /TAXON_ID=91324 /ORGANISM="Lotharella globosa, Strain CCCM811" /LENGTH=341 /DNA_ID=CAMNT_0007688505 /DNA_START=48 /DNA_END=1073 /DNA_ORIENTATION=+